MLTDAHWKLPKGEFSVALADARRYRAAAVAPDQSRLTSALQKIDRPE
ncbi:hypothetical protein [Burkholderia ubonensis]|nr:hypothetical protein [Burkholderia ubonensis]